MDEYEMVQRVAKARGRELDRAIRQIAELEAERDRLRETLDTERAQWLKETRHAASRIGKGVRERDRLRAIVDATRAMWDDLTAVDEDGTQYQFPAVHYAPIDDGLDALGLLDVSPTMGNPPTAAELNRLSAERAGEHYVTPDTGDDDLPDALNHFKR